MVSTLFNHVFTSFELMWMLAEISCELGFMLILFLWFKLMMLMLLLAMFVVVMLEIIEVIFWPQESLWLCVCV